MPIDDGGPAFPWQATDRCGNPTNNYSGVSVRDYFAAKAMQSLLLRSQAAISACSKRYGEDPTDWVAATAYQLADAMIAEREKERQ